MCLAMPGCTRSRHRGVTKALRAGSLRLALAMTALGARSRDPFAWSARYPSMLRFVVAGLDPPAGRSPFGVAKARQPIMLRENRFEEDGCVGQGPRITPLWHWSLWLGHTDLPVLSSPLAKNILLRGWVETAIEGLPSRAHKRGVSRSSRTLGAGCGGRKSVA
jgi:hypothetical protein